MGYNIDNSFYIFILTGCIVTCERLAWSQIIQECYRIFWFWAEIKSCYSMKSMEMKIMGMFLKCCFVFPYADVRLSISIAFLFKETNIKVVMGDTFWVKKNKVSLCHNKEHIHHLFIMRILLQPSHCVTTGKVHGQAAALFVSQTLTENILVWLWYLNAVYHTTLHE